MQNKVIWLMGGSGSGKTTASKAFAELGFKIVNADEIAHKILEKGESAYGEVVLYFGDGILSDSGEIDRERLGAQVFSDKKKLGILNNITHKYIRQELLKIISESRQSVLIDAALPPDGFLLPDITVFVTAPVKTRIARITKRDNISEENAGKRIKSQLSDMDYACLADVTFENEGDANALKAKIKKWCLDEKIT